MQSQDIEDATTAVVIECVHATQSFISLTISPATAQMPKPAATIVNYGQCCYPPQLSRASDSFYRLWAATGQSALESSRILLLSASSTGAAILKNLVLPGIGHFTVLDHRITSAADAGNNFFLDGPSSIGKPRAEEVVRLLSELNDSVEGKADTRDLKDILQSQDGGKEWLCSYQVIIAHNLETELLDQVSKITWEDERKPILVVVNEAGFLAEFGIQFHEHPSESQEVSHLYTSSPPIQSSNHIQKPHHRCVSTKHFLRFLSMRPPSTLLR